MIFIAGIAAIFAGVVIMVAKLKDGDAPKLFVCIAMILTLIYGVLEIVIGISSLSDGRRLANPSGCVTLSKIVIIICIIQLFISLFNGIMAWGLLALFVLGILIPILYLFSSKRGRVKRPPAGRPRYENRRRYS